MRIVELKDPITGPYVLSKRYFLKTTERSLSLWIVKEIAVKTYHCHWHKWFSFSWKPQDFEQLTILRSDGFKTVFMQMSEALKTKDCQLLSQILRSVFRSLITIQLVTSKSAFVFSYRAVVSVVCSIHKSWRVARHSCDTIARRARYPMRHKWEYLIPNNLAYHIQVFNKNKFTHSLKHFLNDDMSFNKMFSSLLSMLTHLFFNWS